MTKAVASLSLSDLFGPRRVRSIDEFPTGVEAAMRWRLERDNLMARAKQEAQFAFSYRDVYYGAAFLICMKGSPDEDRFAIVSGANFTLTPRPKGREKMCAERIGVGQMRGSFAYYAIIGIAIFSNHLRVDDVSGISLDVPYPCYECCDMLTREDVPAHTPLILFRDRGVLACDFIDPRQKGDYIVHDTSFGEIFGLHHRQTG